jgi:hypothetical protein
VNVRGNELTLRAAKKGEFKKKGKYHETWERECCESVALPAGIKTEKVEALAGLGGTQLDLGVGQLLLQLLDLFGGGGLGPRRPTRRPWLQSRQGPLHGFLAQLMEALRADPQDGAGLQQTQLAAHGLQDHLQPPLGQGAAWQLVHVTGSCRSSSTHGVPP